MAQNFLKVQTTSSIPLYLFLDQAAGLSGVRPRLADMPVPGVSGIPVAYINGGVSPALSTQINERYFISNCRIYIALTILLSTNFKITLIQFSTINS